MSWGVSLRPLSDFAKERKAQIRKWGHQHHPDGTDSTTESQWQRDFDQAQCQQAAREGRLTWRLILQEEISEAFAETDPAKLRAELVQSGAVTAAWIEDIDLRTAAAEPTSTEPLRDFKFELPDEHPARRQIRAGAAYIHDQYGDSARD